METQSGDGKLSRAEERALVERAQGGDADALEALLEHFEPVIYRFGMRMCRNPEDARDVLQETLLSAARKLGGFRSEARLSTWLYTIARSYCIKKHRKDRSDTRPLESAREVPSDAPQPDDTASDRELLAALDRATATLDPDNRSVLLLRDVEGLSAAETAEVLGMTVPQVKSRLHRARAAVREHLAPLLSPPEGIPGALKDGCPDVVHNFSRFLEDDIEPALCEEMEDHIAHCEFCSATCDSLKRTVKVCQTVPTPELPRDVVVALRHAIRRHVEAQPSGGESGD